MGMVQGVCRKSVRGVVRHCESLVAVSATQNGKSTAPVVDFLPASTARRGCDDRPWAMCSGDACGCKQRMLVCGHVGAPAATARPSAAPQRRLGHASDVSRSR